MTYILIDQRVFRIFVGDFQSIVRSLGESVAVTRSSSTSRSLLVPSKKAKIGIWIYQLTATLGNNLPFYGLYEDDGSLAFPW